MTPEARKIAEDNLIRRGLAIRLRDGKFLLTEAGRDAADHARMEAREQP